MIIKRISLIIILLILHKYLFCQINYSEIKSKFNSEDCVILDKSRKVIINIDEFDELYLETIDEKRLLFLNNNAGLYAEDEISFSKFWDLKDITVYTEIPHKNRTKKFYVKNFDEQEVLSDNVFYDDIRRIKFYIPSLREDAVVHIKYKMILKVPYFIQSFIFQSTCPIVDTKITFDIDKNIELGFSEINSDSFNIKHQKKINKNRIIHEYSTKNIEKFAFEDNIGGIKHYIPHIIPYIKGYKTKDGYKNILKDVNDLHNWYNSLVIKSALDNDSVIKEFTEGVIQNKNSEKEKVKAVFTWVQQNIKYIAVEDGLSGFIPDSPLNVYKKRYGDCKGMAGLIISMLKSVGIESYYTWVGTRDLPYKYKENHTPSVDNHMIATYIDSPGYYYYLDATDQNLIFGLPTDFIQGKEALISKNGKFEIKEIPIVSSEQNKLIDSLHIEIGENNAIIGSGNAGFTGYFYSTVKNRYDIYINKEKRKEFYSNYLNCGNNKYILNDFQEEIDQETYAFNLKYDFSINDYIIKHNDEIYINMNLFKDLLQDKILNSDILTKHINNHFSYDYHIEFKIPEGWKVTDFPKLSEFSNKYFNYKIDYKLNDNKLIYTIFVSSNTLTLNKEEYQYFNQYIRSLNNSYKETVSLIKVN